MVFDLLLSQGMGEELHNIKGDVTAITGESIEEAYQKVSTDGAKKILFCLACYANTNISCIIDPYRRIVDRVKDEKGQDIFVQGS
jgi:hypothetical protein